MDIKYKAVIVVGLFRKQLSSPELELVDAGVLDEYPPILNESSTNDFNVIGFEFAESNGFSPQEFDWNTPGIDTLKDYFYTLIGKEARTFLAIKEN